MNEYANGLYQGYCQGFTAVPNDISMEASVIWIAGNHIKSLQPNSFNHSLCYNLAIIYDSMETIEADAFNHLDTLSHLFLYNNKIKSLQPGCFRGLPSVTVLHLHSNKIKSLKNGVLNDLTSLTEILLNDNELMHLDSATFQGMSQLITIRLQNNFLDHLPQGLLDLKGDEHPSTIYLAISGNSLECNRSQCWAYDAEQDGWLIWWGGILDGPQCRGLRTWSQMNLICAEDGK